MLKLPLAAVSADAATAMSKAAGQWGLAAAMLLLLCLRMSRQAAWAQAAARPARPLMRRLPGYALSASILLMPEPALAHEGSTAEIRADRHVFADLHAGSSVAGVEAGVYLPLDSAIVATARTRGNSDDIVRDTGLIGFRKYFGNSLYASLAAGGAMLHDGDQVRASDEEGPLDRGLVYDVAIGNQWLFRGGFSLGVEWIGRELWAVHRPGRRDAGRAMTVALGVAF
jgi:hypothetical protein